jgi:hypothetical protein
MFVELRERLARSGTELVVLGVPIWFAVDAEFMERMFKGGMELDADLPSRRLAAAAEAHALHVLDLTPLFRAALERGEGPFYFPRDRHWNPEGHRFAAEALTGFVKEKGLVPVAGG